MHTNKKRNCNAHIKKRQAINPHDLQRISSLSLTIQQKRTSLPIHRQKLLHRSQRALESRERIPPCPSSDDSGGRWCRRCEMELVGGGGGMRCDGGGAVRRGGDEGGAVSDGS